MDWSNDKAFVSCCGYRLRQSTTPTAMPHLIIYIVVGLSWNSFPLEGWDGLLVYYVFSISLWEYRYSQQDIYLYLYYFLISVATRRMVTYHAP